MVQAARRKHHFIYKTTCLITNKFYVGMHSTDHLDDGYLGSGKQLWYSVKKHGKENHVRIILEFCFDRQGLKQREEELVNEKLVNDPLCMNLIKGGNATPEMPGIQTGAKISAALKGRKNPEHSARLKGRKLTEEHKRRIGESNIGKHSIFGRIPWMKGKKHTESARQKIADSNIGNTRARGKRTDEQKQSIAEATFRAMQNPVIREKCGSWARSGSV